MVSAVSGVDFLKNNQKYYRERAVTSACLESSTVALQDRHRRGTPNKEKNIRQNINYHRTGEKGRDEGKGQQTLSFGSLAPHIRNLPL